MGKDDDVGGCRRPVEVNDLIGVAAVKVFVDLSVSLVDADAPAQV